MFLRGVEVLWRHRWIRSRSRGLGLGFRVRVANVMLVGAQDAEAVGARDVAALRGPFVVPDFVGGALRNRLRRTAEHGVPGLDGYTPFSWHSLLESSVSPTPASRPCSTH